MANPDVLSLKLEMLHSDVVEVKTALNKLSEAITKLALVEQQQTQTAEALERAFKTISKIDDRLSALELTAPKHQETSGWMDRFILAIIVAAMGFLGTKLGAL
jgi:menaquinone-dependent protoporphyrinogen IX oxidase